MRQAADANSRSVLLFVRDALRGTRRFKEPRAGKNILVDRLRKLGGAGVRATQPSAEGSRRNHYICLRKADGFRLRIRISRQPPAVDEVAAVGVAAGRGLARRASRARGALVCGRTACLAAISSRTMASWCSA